jgi:hypothetical protein
VVFVVRCGERREDKGREGKRGDPTLIKII